MLDCRPLDAGGDLGLDPSSLPVRINWRDSRCLALPVLAARWAAAVPRRSLRLRKAYHRSYTSEIHPALVEEATRLRHQNLSSLSAAKLGGRIVACVGRLTGELMVYHQLSDNLAMGPHHRSSRDARG